MFRHRLKERTCTVGLDAGGKANTRRRCRQKCGCICCTKPCTKWHGCPAVRCVGHHCLQARARLPRARYQANYRDGRGPQNRSFRVDSDSTLRLTSNVQAISTFTDHFLQEGGAFDIVVANILCEPLLQLVDTLSCATAPAGKLCLSGVRRLPDLRAVEALQDTYSEQFENFQISDAGAGWCVITAEKGLVRLKLSCTRSVLEARFLFRDHDSWC